MKKIIALILALAMVFALCACAAAPESGKESGSETKEETKKEETKKEDNKEAANGETVITIWMTGADGQSNIYNQAFSAKCAEFDEAHDDIKLDISYIGEGAEEYSEKWTMAAQAKNFPDVFYSTIGYADEWSEAGLLSDFGPELLGDEEFVSGFASGAIESTSEAVGEGTLYGVPSDMAVQGWVYNDELFEQCGLEIPETWEDLLHCVEVFKENGITPILHGGVDKWAIWGYHSFFTRYGLTQPMAQDLQSGKIKFADCSAITKAFGRMEELAKAGAIDPNAYTTQHATAWELFLAGKGAMYTVYDVIEGSVQDKSLVQNKSFNFGPEFPDGVLEGKSGLRMIGWHYLTGASAKATPEKTAAVTEFLKFIGSQDFSQAVVDKGMTPATAYDFTYASDISDLRKSENEALVADIIPTTDAFVNWFDTAYTDVYYNAVTGVLLGQISAAEGVQMLQDCCDSLN